MTKPSGPLCEDCRERLDALVDDWNHLCDVLRLADQERAEGFVLAVLEAYENCEEASGV